ncbi:cation:proton antiporter [Staphylococcus massiliensis]|uniref:cation:proton antiporter n=1 Tax=Staphylococcus massiliensis TaxID=555791 RepID=UPI0002EBF94C|nr:sodium:proton antiporter [Staphylococcus massiliensis]MCG3399606.1 sodium:proton antiporter [Staphylococcus massiliensis]MCG3413313.1 sodium:proton antiporter [Staphylococcus massiliensis]PNZ99001.1 sodium:proton antiporter [Staphylococcus massiliensis CCUG 55927]
MTFDLPVTLTIVMFLALGIFSQWLAVNIKWPSIVVMACVGLLIGPILGIINPKEVIGHEVFGALVSLAVAIILFEGSSNLDFRELRGISKAVVRIITFGALISWILGTIALHVFMHFPLPISFVMGGLFLITGPTVIQPLLKQAKVKKNVDSVLKWESIILDPIGPMLALMAFYVYQIISQGISFVLIIEFILQILAVLIIGFGVSFIFKMLVSRDMIPQALIPSVQLVFILLTFSICDEVLKESGLLAVTIFGIMMARQKRHDLIYKESDHFIENTSSILVSSVFILITSSLTLGVLKSVLSWQLVLLCVAMIILVRPLSVWLSTIGTELDNKERSLVALMAPRGIVVLTVAQFFSSLFIADKVDMAKYITPVTFGLVFITVVIYGFSFRPLSKALGMASTEPPGVIIVGEGEFSFHLGVKLREHNIPVMVFNLFENTNEKAHELDFETFKGNLLSSSDRIYTDLIRYDKCILMTKSFIFNSLAFNELVPEFGLKNVAMMPVSFDDDQARNNLNGPIRNHILFDDRYSPRWFNQYISNHNIIEVPAYDYEHISEKDMMIYHISDDSEVTFKMNNRPLPKSDSGVYGILKDIYG